MLLHEECNLSLPDGADHRWHEIYLTTIWKCGCSDLNEGRGRQWKRFKKGNVIDIVGIPFKPFVMSACATVHAGLCVHVGTFL